MNKKSRFYEKKSIDEAEEPMFSRFFVQVVRPQGHYGYDPIEEGSRIALPGSPYPVNVEVQGDVLMDIRIFRAAWMGDMPVGPYMDQEIDQLQQADQVEVISSPLAEALRRYVQRGEWGSAKFSSDGKFAHWYEIFYRYFRGEDFSIQ